MHRPRCPAVSRLRRSGALAALTLALLSAGGGAHASARRGAAAGRAAPIANVQVSHDDVTSYGQPALAVNPRNPSNLLGVAWTAHDTEETFVSVDGGRTWRDNGPLPLPAGVSFGGDPSVAFDARGTGFVATLGESQTGDGVYVWRSDDGGRSRSASVRVTAGLPHQAIPFQPHVVVDDQGVADVAFFVLAYGRVDLMLACSTRGVVGPPRRITNTSFDPSLGWHTRRPERGGSGIIRASRPAAA